LQRDRIEPILPSTYHGHRGRAVFASRLEHISA
jgi:hypothetical protein